MNGSVFLFLFFFFSLSACPYKESLSKSVFVTVNPLEQLTAFFGMILLLLLITKLMCCPKNKCQEIYYSNDVCMMQSSLGVLVVIAMVKEGFHFLGTLGW